MKQLLLLITSFTLNIVCSSIELSSALEISQTPLMQAAAEGDIENLKELLIEVHADPPYYLSHSDINAQDTQGRTALFIAAQEGQAEIVKQLLKVKNIDINLADKDGMTPLQVAVTSGDSDTVNALLDLCEKGQPCPGLEQRDKKLKFTPLARAALSGNAQIIKLLLAAGANPSAVVTSLGINIAVRELYKGDDKETIDLIKSKDTEYEKRTQNFIKALQDKNPDEARKILKEGIDVNAKDSYDITPLYFAASNGYTDIVQTLIKNGADVNARTSGNVTPLHWAHKKDVIELLINNNADVNALSFNGHTPLLLAVLAQDKDIVELLIENKAQVNAKVRLDATALHWAADKGDKDIAELLIKAGADVNAKDRHGETPLHWAVYRGHKAIIKLLIDSGAEVDAEDDYGQRPLFKAIERRSNVDRVEIIDMLIKAGAQ